MATLNHTIRQMRSRLTPLYGPRESEAMIRLIFETLKGWKPVDLVLRDTEPLSDFIEGKIDAILRRAENGEPLQYILGHAHFRGMDFTVRPGVLIPRPETAELIDIVEQWAAGCPDLRILDAGTGSGCIAIALSRALRFPQITAIDISDTALSTARENASALHARITLRKADILHLQPEPDSLDAIVSNPPYIVPLESKEMERNVLDFEPHEALFAPASDPLAFYRALIHYGQKALSAEGALFFEINPLYATELKVLTEQSGYTSVTLHQDLQGRIRFLSALKNGPSNTL